MHHKEFVRKLDETRIVKAIAETERKSSGEIRVYISHRRRTDPLKFARKRFVELGMTQTRHRNAVLIYLVTLTRQFAVVFFFQAEDGIRDLTVTGVQTCALPI